MPEGFWGPIIGSVAGGAIDAWTQQQANKANAQNAKDQMAFQASQSSTEYQRGVEDMKKAGLNPALAYSQGGASSGSGTSAKADPLTQNTPSKFATALDAYQAIANGAAQRDLLREQATAQHSAAILAETQAATMLPDARIGRDTAYASQYYKTRFQQRLGEEFEARGTPTRFNATMANIGASTAQAQAATAEARSRTTLNEQNFQNVWFRRKVAPYLNSTAKVIQTF